MAGIGALLVAAACGDGQVQSSASVAGKAAATDGAWSGVGQWPFIPIHAAVLPDGRVLTYGSTPDGEQGGHLQYDVWDPNAGLGTDAHLTLPNSTSVDTFCSSGLLLPQSGNFMTASGDWRGRPDGYGYNRNRDVVAFDYRDNSARQLSQVLNHQRWYGTMTMMPNGEVLLQGGTCWGGTSQVCTAGVVEAITPEIYRPSGGWQMLAGARSETYYGALHSRWWYPRSWVAPDGRVFGISAGTDMYYLNTAGQGSIQSAGTLGFDNFGNSGSAVMYRPGKILVVGGGNTTNDGNAADGRDAAKIIDINSGYPVVSPTASLPTGRHWLNATVLADGQVLVTGGSTTNNKTWDATRNAAIWNPDTGRWTIGAANALPRLYHSSAVLLPDGRVLSGGGGAPGPLVNNNAEVYSPPYLFDAAGNPAVRPVIASAPTQLAWGGQRFAVGLQSATGIARVALVALGSNTHSFDMSQRYLPLSFSQSGSGLSVDRPASANIAPPGYYMLFVIDNNGVPSVARILRIVSADIVASADMPGSQTVGEDGNDNAGNAPQPAPPSVQPQPETEQPQPGPPQENAGEGGATPAPADSADGSGHCNGISNGGFEQGVQGWFVGGEHEVVDGFGGQRALRISGATIGNRLATASGDRTYILSGDYTASGETGWAGYGIDFFNSAGAKIGQSIADLANSASVQSFELTARAPAQTASARLWVFVGAGRSAVLDNIALGPQSCANAQQCNLFANPGFEQGTTGWSVPNDATLTNASYEGAGALRFSNGSIGSAAVAVTAGTGYTLQVFANAVGSGGWAGIGIDYFDATATKIATLAAPLTPGSGYQATSVSGPAPASAEFARIWVFGSEGRELSLDNMRFAPGHCVN